MTADDCTFIEGGGSADAVAGRLAQLRVELGRAVHERDVEILQERIARLSANLAVIRVGAPTEPALKERFRRTEGALAATQAAVSEGVVPGGGTALLRAAGALDSLSLTGDYARGAEIVRSVLSEPLYWIASNAGYDGQAAIDQVLAAPGRSRPQRVDRRVRRPVREGRDRPGPRHAARRSSTRPRSRRCCSPPRRSSPRN